MQQRLQKPGRLVKRGAPKKTVQRTVYDDDGAPSESTYSVIAGPLRAWARRTSQESSTIGEACRQWLGNKRTK